MSEPTAPLKTQEATGAEKYRRLPERFRLDQVVTTQATTAAGLLWLTTAVGADCGNGGDGDGD